MIIDINASSGIPIYRQIIDQIKVAVGTGALQVGDRLPSVRGLSESLVVNPTTVQKAYVELEREGVVETRRGQGTFVGQCDVVLRSQEIEKRIEESLDQVFAEALRYRVDLDTLRRWIERRLDRIYRKQESEDKESRS